MARSLDKERYYYAGGERIKLTPAPDLLAVDGRLLRASGKKDLLDELQQAGGATRSGIQIVSRDAISSRAAAALKKTCTLQPVFRAEGAIIVALPEVRVAANRPAAQKRLRQWLDLHGNRAVVCSDRAGKIVLEPVSGYGEDALTLANELTEEVKPEMAQARFLRVLRKPFAA